MDEYKELEEVFKFHRLIGTFPTLSAWDEIELYRKFNKGHLPTDKLHTPWQGFNRKGIMLSTITARALWGRG